MACRDLDKGAKAAIALELPNGAFEIMHLDLCSFTSVRTFHAAFRAQGLSPKASDAVRSEELV